VGLEFKLPGYQITHLPISMALSLTSQPQTHPGVGRFVANESSTAIRQPYDSLVEALFPAVLGFVWLIAEC
jgi:hypothetical protein